MRRLEDDSVAQEVQRGKPLVQKYSLVQTKLSQQTLSETLITKLQSSLLRRLKRQNCVGCIGVEITSHLSMLVGNLFIVVSES